MQSCLEVKQSLSDKHNIGLDLFSLSDNGLRKPVSRITLYVNNENDQVYTAGDDTGLELTATCIYATQEMANTLLSMAKGAQYRMYEAQAANLDPAAELGDGVSVGGIDSIIAQISDNGDGYPDISASGEQEVEDEYPGAGGKGPIQRELARARSLISKTNDRISFEIYGEDGKGGLNGRMNTFTMGLSGISGQIKGYQETLTGYQEQLVRYDADLSGFSADIKRYSSDVARYTNETASYKFAVDQFETRVETYQEQAGKTEEAYSTISQKVDSIKMEVTNGDDSASIQLVVDGKNQGAPAEIKMTGLVTITDLKTKGSTVINGSNITTGKIDAQYLNLSGKLTFNVFTEAAKTSIKNTASDAASTYIDSWLVSAPTIEGLTVAGGVFTDIAQEVELYLNKNNTDYALVLEDGEGEVLNIWGGFGGDTGGIMLRGQDFVVYNGGTFYAWGKWDFSHANVTGL